MNAPAVENAGGNLEVPDFIYPIILSADGEVLPLGSPGRFTFLDPTIRSFPGFISTNYRVTLIDDHEFSSEISLMKTEIKGCSKILERVLEGN